MRSDTLFRIASMTKPITSAAALMLVEEGGMALDDPISRWVPELADPLVLRDAAGPCDDVTPPGGRSPSRTCSPIARASPTASSRKARSSRPTSARSGDPAMNRLTPDEWLAALGGLPLAYQPGERFHYGHSTDVLGFLIGRVEGKPCVGSCMSGSSRRWAWRTPTSGCRARSVIRLASLYGYDEATGRLAKVEPEMYDEPPSYTPGGGGLISSAADYHRFARMLLGDGALDGVRLLQPETVALMRTNRLTDVQRRSRSRACRCGASPASAWGCRSPRIVVDNPYACGAPGLDDLAGHLRHLVAGRSGQ